LAVFVAYEWNGLAKALVSEKWPALVSLGGAVMGPWGIARESTVLVGTAFTACVITFGSTMLSMIMKKND
jgi:hypothetical protein